MPTTIQLLNQLETQLIITKGKVKRVSLPNRFEETNQTKQAKLMIISRDFNLMELKLNLAQLIILVLMV